MNIAVLNECFLTEVHLARLKKLGNVTIFTDTNTEQKVIERLKNVDAAIADCFVAPLNEYVFSQLPVLKFLTISSIGYDPLDLETAKKRNILVANIPGYSKDAVAEHTIALMFAAVKKIIPMDKLMRDTPYEIDPGDADQILYRSFTIRNKVMGIIGTGNIGRRVAHIAHALGMKVLVYSRTQQPITDARYVSLEELLTESDVVSIHAPLNKESENLIGEKEFSLMKKHAVLINTARGKIVQTEALYRALSSHVIGGAGLDVIVDAPKNHPIFGLDTIVFTPHAAWNTKETFENMADMLVDNIEAFVQGKPIHVIT